MASKLHPTATNASEYPAMSHTVVAGGTTGQSFAGTLVPAFDSAWPWVPDTV